MDNGQSNEEIIFSITVEDVQKEAVSLIGRKLTEEANRTDFSHYAPRNFSR